MTYFNPRSREGSDQEPQENKTENQYFNPRSREGSDFDTFYAALHHTHFNPRSREGSDFQIVIAFKRRKISIHAPAKGATPSSDFRIRFYDISIHAPAKGATYYWDNSQMSVKFQSTLPRRERLDNIALTRLGWYFNPRSREGSDALFPVGGFVFDHFNPRSREGSDLTSLVIGSQQDVFQSTLPRRERPARPCTQAPE